jgi:hypothetical protein
MAISPATHPDLFQCVIYNGVRSPGVVKLSGHDREINIEVKTPKGSTGCSTVIHGHQPRAFQATFTLADEDDVADWDTFAKLLLTDQKAPKPKARQCYHPDLLRNLILDVVVQSIGGLTYADNGMATVAVKFQQHEPPKAKAASKPKAERKGVTTIDPNAAAKRELELLIEQAKGP